MGWILRRAPLPGALAVVYLIVAFIDEAVFARTIISLPLPSDRAWAIEVRDLFLVAGLILLYLEIFKSTRTTNVEISEHTLSFLALVATLLIFLLVPKMGTSLFGLITLMCAMDVIAGFTVTISAARRSVGIERAS
jgi:hypothetical protein